VDWCCFQMGIIALVTASDCCFLIRSAGALVSFLAAVEALSSGDSSFGWRCLADFHVSAIFDEATTLAARLLRGFGCVGSLESAVPEVSVAIGLSLFPVGWSMMLWMESQMALFDGPANGLSALVALAAAVVAEALGVRLCLSPAAVEPFAFPLVAPLPVGVDLGVVAAMAPLLGTVGVNFAFRPS
jgi:hypothetical protein